MTITFGSEFTVGSKPTALGQIGQYPVATTLANGTVAVAFSEIFASQADQAFDSDVFVRVLGPDGATVSAVSDVNDTTVKMHSEPKITALSDGGFMVSWTRAGPKSATDSTFDRDVFVRAFNADGSARGPAVLASTGGIEKSEDHSFLTELPGGGAALVWTTRYDGMFARTVSANGQTLGAPVKVTASDDPYAELLTLADGRVALVTFAGQSYGHNIRISDADLTSNVTTIENRPNEIGEARTMQASATALPGGGFALVYRQDPDIRVDDDDRIWIDKFDASGALVARTSFADPEERISERLIKIVGLDGDRMLLSYTSAVNYGDTDVFARLIGADMVVGAEQRVNVNTAGLQNSVSLTVLENGNVMAVFSDGSPVEIDGVKDTLHGRVIEVGAPPPPPGYQEGTEAADRLSGVPGEQSHLDGLAGDDLLMGDGPMPSLTPQIAAQVYRLYQATLDRAPDLTGLTNWSERLDTGAATLAQVASGFVASPEFKETYGALNNADFVNLLYNNVLGRAADATGLANWTAKLDNGMSRAEVVLGFSESGEFRAGTQAEARAFIMGSDSGTWADDVFRLYQATLDRAPDSGGFTRWTTELSKGGALADVAAGFVNSPEFKATYGALSNADFVELLYQNVLNRAGDAQGLANWTARLDSGMSRVDVLLGFSQSAEFRSATAPALKDWMRAQQADDLLEGGPGADRLVGGSGADTFVFDLSDIGSGTDRVVDLEPWDMLQMKGYSFTEANSFMDHLAQVGADVVFSYDTGQIVFENTSLAYFGEDMLI